MSLLPASLAATIVMLLASASAQLVRDTALSQAQWERQQLAMSRAELLLIRSAAGLSPISGTQPGDESGKEQEVLVERLNVSHFTEMSDLPLTVFRISTVGPASQYSVHVQADYALEVCDEDEGEDEHEKETGSEKINEKINELGDKRTSQANSCKPTIRRLAWRRLQN